MDRLNHYRILIKEILTEDARFKPSHGDIESHLVFDDDHGSYQLMYIGWDGMRRVHGPVIHVRLYNGKIYIEYDGTRESIATALLERGVPKEDIVLAFHHPDKRKYTEFAVA
jgi:hypothetical protein